MIGIAGRTPWSAISSASGACSSPTTEFGERLVHDSKVKVHIVGEDGKEFDRIPAYIRRVVQESAAAIWAGVYWSPPDPFAFKHSVRPLDGALRDLRIARRHGAGGARRSARSPSSPATSCRGSPGWDTTPCSSWRSRSIRITARSAITSAASSASRLAFGTPEELKELIDTAHGLGLRVLLDVVHSHAVKNTREGLGWFDGTDHQYFHAGPRGQHPAWDSLLFDYAKYEVQRFLLSNVRYWLEEYRFDGFRFDGVTSMIYRDHGLGKAFTSYDDYFGGNIDEDAVDLSQDGQPTRPRS